MGNAPKLREKRHRLERAAYIGEVTVAFTACIAGRKQAFMDASIVRIFADVLERAARRHRSTVLLHCFMPNHVHVVLQGFAPGADVWRAMVEFKQRTGYWLRLNRAETRWQKDFFDRVIRSDGDLIDVLRYIVDNPVRAGLGTTWQDYPFLGSDEYRLEEIVGAA